MRHEKALMVLELAQRMAGTAEGLTLDEMAGGLGVTRRTAERLRDAASQLFPQMEVLWDPPHKRYRIPSGLDGLFQAPTPDEMAALNRAAESSPASASGLRSLERKILSAMRVGVRRRLAPDVEALVQAEAIAVHAGPRPHQDERALGVIREALVGLKALRFRYDGGSRPGAVREVTPYGLLFGRANYLVGADFGTDNAKSWRLDLLREPKALKRPAAPPEGFSLQAYADQSFGVYHDQIEDVALRFTADAAPAVRRWRFHLSQTLEEAAGGAVVVRFRASGMRELAWHLFTWGPDVEVLAPDRLRTLLVRELEGALARHRAPA